MRKLFTAALLSSLLQVLGGVGAPIPIHACSCAGRSVAQARDDSDMVFSGRADAVRLLKPRPGAPQIATFAVGEVWKGQRLPTVDVYSTGASGCGFEFTEDEEYLVYARRSGSATARGADYLTDFCMRTKHMQRAYKDLTDLGPSVPIGDVCPQMARHIPDAVRLDAIANREGYAGWGQLRDPGKPASPFNSYRIWLSIRDPGLAFGPHNGVLWKAGCP